MHCSCLNINQLESVNVCDWHVLWESVRLFVVTASVDRLVTTRLCAFAGWWWRGRQSWGLGTAAGCRQPTQTRVLTADCRVTLTATKVLPSCLRCQCWGFLKLHCSSFEHLSQFTLVTCWSSYYLETVALPEKHFIPLSLSTCLNSFLTVFHPDPCIFPIQISLPDHPVLLATFPLGPFLCLHLLLGTLYLHTFVLSTPYAVKHLKFNLLQSAFTT